MVLPVIGARILDAAPLSLRFTFSVIFQGSQPYSRVDITEAVPIIIFTFSLQKVTVNYCVITIASTSDRDHIWSLCASSSKCAATDLTIENNIAGLKLIYAIL